MTIKELFTMLKKGNEFSRTFNLNEHKLQICFDWEEHDFDDWQCLLSYLQKEFTLRYQKAFLSAEFIGKDHYYFAEFEVVDSFGSNDKYRVEVFLNIKD